MYPNFAIFFCKAPIYKEVARGNIGQNCFGLKMEAFPMRNMLIYNSLAE